MIVVTDHNLKGSYNSYRIASAVSGVTTLNLKGNYNKSPIAYNDSAGVTTLNLFSSMKTLDKTIYTLKEACEMFSISRRTLNQWCDHGILKKITIPGRRRVYIDAESIRKLIGN